MYTSKKALVFFILFSILNVIFSKSEISISHVSLLLSWNSRGTTIEASGADCFNWSVMDTNLIKIVPIYKNKEAEKISCTNKVTVIPVGLSNQRRSTIVYAKYQDSEVECEVFLDNIASLNILTAARRIYFGELITLEVQAFDKEGNVFSSLQGLNFKWKTSELEEQKDTIQLMPLSDKTVKITVSDYSSSSSIIAKGTKIGKGSVSVLLDQSKDNLEFTVQFYVLDKLKLLPSSFLRVLRGSLIQYSLQRNIEGRLEDLDSLNYQWTLTNETVAEISPRGLLRSLELGQSQIVVKDKSFDMNEVRGTLIVSQPYYLKFKVEQITPHFYENILKITNYVNEPLNFVKNYKYEVTVEVYNPDNQLIHITNDFLFNVTVNGNLMIHNFSKNKQVFTIESNTTGTFELSASLLYDDKVLSLSSPIRVFEKIKIQYEKDTIYLPTDEGVQQTFLVKVTGGSGDYIFLTKNNDMMKIDDGGLLTTFAEGEGHLFVVDAQNTLNGDFKKVYVSIPASLSFKKGIRETPFETTLCLDLNVQDSKGNLFTQFDSLHFIWQIIDPTIFQYVKTQECLYGFRANSIGHTAVKVRYRKTRMQDKTFIASFMPLKIERPNDNPIVTLGSEIEFILTGGPYKWMNSSVLLHKSSIKDEKLIKLDFISANEKEQIYKAKCLNYGEQVITFITEQNLNQEDSENTVATTSILYSCHEPVSLKVVPLNPKTNQEVAPIPVSGSKILVYNIKNNQTIDVKINVFNSENKMFYDISTLNIDWNLKENNFAKLITSPIVGKNKLEIQDKEGFLFLDATIIGYLPEVRFEGTLKPVYGEAELRVTFDLMVNPPWYLLFKHPKNKYQITTTGGSGKFDYKLNNSRIISFNQVTSNSIEVTPLNEGYAGVKSHDLTFGTFAEATTKVSDVYSIQMNGSRLVQENHNISIKILAYDEEGNKFDHFNIEHMNPKVEIDYVQIATIKPSSLKDTFIVYGISEGTVKITGSVTTSEGKKMFTLPFYIQVYKELKIDPPYLLLIPGSIYQVLVTGGPAEGQMQTTFKILNQSPENTIRIDANGAITAINYGTANIEIERKYDRQTFATLYLKVDVVKIKRFLLPSELTIYQGKCSTLSVKGESFEGNLTTLNLQSNYFGVSFSTEQNNIQIIGSSKEHYGMLSSIVICAHHELGKSDINIHGVFNHPTLQSWELYSKITINVEKKLCINGLCPEEIIMTPKSSYEIEPNKNLNSIKYSSTLNDLIHVDKRGIINSYEREGYSGVLIEDLIDFESILQKVRITRPDNFGIESPETKKLVNEISVPMGQNLMIKLNGLKKGEYLSSFNGLELKDRLNIQDIISVDFKKKGYIMITTLREGQVCLEISSPLIESLYIKFIVFGAITPINPKLIIGDTIKFKIISKDIGYWESENNEILSIDEDGNSKAKKNGKTKISFTSNQMTTYSPIYISKISSGNVIVQKNVISDLEFEANIQLFDELGNDISIVPNGIIRDLNLECASKNDNFEVKTVKVSSQSIKCLLKTRIDKGIERVELFVKHDNYNIDLPSFTVHVSSLIEKEDSGSLKIIIILFIIGAAIFYLGKRDQKRNVDVNPDEEDEEFENVSQ